jgi:hypothetical protein
MRALLPSILNIEGYFRELCRLVVIGRGPLSVTPEVELIDWRLCRWRIFLYPAFKQIRIQMIDDSVEEWLHFRPDEILASDSPCARPGFRYASPSSKPPRSTQAECVAANALIYARL